MIIMPVQSYLRFLNFKDSNYQAFSIKRLYTQAWNFLKCSNKKFIHIVTPKQRVKTKISLNSLFFTKKKQERERERSTKNRDKIKTLLATTLFFSFYDIPQKQTCD